ncbi:MFS transporter [Companilactobacillus alimentarius]
MQKKQSILTITIVLVGYFIILVDTSFVFTCSKEISSSLQMTASLAAWISNAYALTFGSLLLLGGKLGDIFGRRKIFIIGLIIFGISSGLVGLSPTAGLLILFRAIQGIGAAIIAPATLAIIMDSFKGNDRVVAISIYGAMSGIGVSLGLIVEAGITTILSWRWGFFVNILIVIILIILSLNFLQKGTIQHEKIDLNGSIFSCLALIFIINGISGIGSHLISLTIGFLLLVYFIYHEYKSDKPILPLALFGSMKRNLAYIIRFTYSSAITSFWFFTPLMLQSNFHLDPIMVGISFLPMTIFNFISANLVSDLTKKIGSIKLMTGGLIITTIGFGGLTLYQMGSNYWLSIALPMITIGIGQGLVLSPVTNIAVEDTPENLSGVSSSMINVMLQIGGAFGLAILSATSNLLNPQNLAFHYQAQGIMLFSLIALIFSLVLRFKFKKYEN